jgi:hypothetical protein
MSVSGRGRGGRERSLRSSPVALGVDYQLIRGCIRYAARNACANSRSENAWRGVDPVQSLRPRSGCAARSALRTQPPPDTRDAETFWSEFCRPTVRRFSGADPDHIVASCQSRPTIRAAIGEVQKRRSGLPDLIRPTPWAASSLTMRQSSGGCERFSAARIGGRRDTRRRCGPRQSG